MKQTALFIGLFLLLAPSLALAQAQPTCSAQGYTVVFVNGIFDTELEAQQDKQALNKKLGFQYNGQPIIVQLGYNPTHLAGAGDILQSAAQLFATSISNFDLNTVLMEVYPEVTTRKLMLVGHSQGAFYTNEMYSYLLAHGEPKEALAVYNVASPATYTAGGGKYLNSSGDAALQYMRLANAKILPNNIDLMPKNSGALAGHGLVEDYLGQAGGRIVDEVDAELGSLVPADASDAGDCFTPPTATLGFKAQRVGFAIADPTATVLKVGAVTTYHAGAVAVKAATRFAVGAFQFLADTITLASAPPTDAQATTKTNTVAGKLYGSSLNGLSAQDKKDLLGSSQGSAAILALAPQKDEPPAKAGLVLGASTEVAPTITPSAPPNIFPMSSNGPVFVGGGGAPAASVSEPVVAPSKSDTDTALTDLATTTATSVDSTDEASSTPPVVDDTPTDPLADEESPDISLSSTGSIISSQLDSSGSPSHYWHSDGSTGTYLALDPTSGAPGYSIGVIGTSSTVLSIHIKAQFSTNGAFSNLPTFVRIYDESDNNPYTCASMPYGGYAYGTPADAQTLSNPLTLAQFEGAMVDMYFQCAMGAGHDQTTAGTSYRLYVYPVSTADISDVYLAMNAAGTVPFYEISSDGVY